MPLIVLRITNFMKAYTIASFMKQTSLTVVDCLYKYKINITSTSERRYVNSSLTYVIKYQRKAHPKGQRF
jgi:hypothetical protein